MRGLICTENTLYAVHTQVILVTMDSGTYYEGYLEQDPAQKIGKFPSNYVAEINMDLRRGVGNNRVKAGTGAFPYNP